MAVNSNTFSSIQKFGMNRFDRGHGLLGSYNMGIAYPLGAFDVPAGATISNKLNIFARSSALSDPAFVDCDISVGHYFVSYEAIDHLYRLRAQTFKGMSTNVPLPSIVLGCDGDGSGNTWEQMNAMFAPGSLWDHLGLSLEATSQTSTETLMSENFPLYPLFAYHMIMDRFFRNSKVEDVEFWKKAFINTFPLMSKTQEIVKFSYNPDPDTGGFGFNDVSEDYHMPIDALNKLFFLEYVNFEPDYFTTARPQANGPAVSIPSGAQATIPNLLDAMLYQKVADMLERGGYSYNDFLRVLYGETPNDDESTYPIFLGGATAPLQVSTVVNQAMPSSPDAGNALGTEAGTVSSYLNGDRGFTRTFHRAGIYMPLMWIRPKTYYSSGVTPIWRQLTLGDQLIPQLADVQDQPIYLSEVQASVFDVGAGGFSSNPPVFGYKDRYQEYRTTPNRVVGEMRTNRSSWYINRKFSTGGIGPAFLTQANVQYNPWVVTDPNVDHFYCRIWHSLENTVPLPAVSSPFIF